MSRCVTDSCNQGRENCPTRAACFAEAEPKDFTQRETFGWLALALALAVAVTLAAFVVSVVSIIGPLFLAAVK